MSTDCNVGLKKLWDILGDLSWILERIVSQTVMDRGYNGPAHFGITCTARIKLKLNNTVHPEKHAINKVGRSR